ncbi:hypothetical protein R3P38DRAFT_3185488 [Favolaschia claudopus]|uniref:F-box domain-containing protein n=1 Tax=Favolaschia claudopus TaxID=2862362 RepID=A0AAW0C3K6_9AGAR
MAYDMSDPAQRAIVHDRLLAGICPTLGPQRLTRKRRQAKAERLTRERLAREAVEPPLQGPALARQKRREVMEFYGGMRLRPLKPKPTLISIARENLERSLARQRSQPVDLNSRGNTSPGKNSSGNLGQPLQHALPHIPHGASFRDRLAALFGEEMASLSEKQGREMKERALAEQDRARAEGAMIPVAAEILEVGAETRQLEKREIGPAPPGYVYVQEGEQLLLALIGYEESGMLIGDADGGILAQQNRSSLSAWRRDDPEARKNIEQWDVQKHLKLTDSRRAKQLLKNLPELTEWSPILQPASDNPQLRCCKFGPMDDFESSHEELRSLARAQLARGTQAQHTIDLHIRMLKGMIRSRSRDRRVASLSYSASRKAQKEIRRWSRMIRQLRERRNTIDLVVSYEVCCRMALDAVSRGEADPELFDETFPPAFLLSHSLSVRTDNGVRDFLHSMLPQLPNSCLCEILRLVNPNIQAAAILVSRRFAHIARAELYRVVQVEGDQTHKFFSTLQKRQELGALVKKLTLAGIAYEGDNNDLQAAFSSLVNLRALHIHYIRLGFAHLLKKIPGQLEDLLYWPTICDDAIDFLLLQPHITSVFFGDLNLVAINLPAFLPHLTDITAPPEDLIVIVPSRPVKHVEFQYSDGDQVRQPIISLKFLASSLAPRLLRYQDLNVLLPDIRRLVIYQDKSWGSASVAADDFDDSIDSMVAIVDQMSTIRHLVIACTYSVSQARLIRHKFVANSQLDLDVLVIGTTDSILYWTDMSHASEFICLPLEPAAARYIKNLRY